MWLLSKPTKHRRGEGLIKIPITACCHLLPPAAAPAAAPAPGTSGHAGGPNAPSWASCRARRLLGPVIGITCRPDTPGQACSLLSSCLFHCCTNAPAAGLLALQLVDAACCFCASASAAANCCCSLLPCRQHKLHSDYHTYSWLLTATRLQVQLWCRLQPRC